MKEYSQESISVWRRCKNLQGGTEMQVQCSTRTVCGVAHARNGRKYGSIHLQLSQCNDSNEAFQMLNGKDQEGPTYQFSDRENNFISIFQLIKSLPVG